LAHEEPEAAALARGLVDEATAADPSRRAAPAAREAVEARLASGQLEEIDVGLALDREREGDRVAPRRPARVADERARDRIDLLSLEVVDGRSPGEEVAAAARELGARPGQRHDEEARDVVDLDRARGPLEDDRA